MKIGFNMLLWTTHLTQEHFVLLEQLKRIGYHGVEVPIFEGDVKHYKNIAKVLHENGLAATVVSVIPDEEHNPISQNAAHRQGGLDYLKWVIDCSQALGAGVICGPFYQPLGAFSGRGATETEKQHGIEFHRKTADYAAKANITLAIEPLNRFECYFLNLVENAADYARAVECSNFGILYDTFHANIEEKDPVGCIGKNIDMIKHVHISENDRGTVGRGHIDWHNTFRALRTANYDGWLVIEAFGRALPDLAAATRVWRDLFTDSEEVYREGLHFVKQQWTLAV